MPVPRRPWQPRDDAAARRARIRSVSRGVGVAVLVLVLAIAGSVAGIVTSNRQHGVDRAAAAGVTSTAAGSTGSDSGTSSAAGADPGQASTSATVAATVLQVAATTTPTSQGQPGVVPVPLAPKADAGPIPLLAWEAYHRAAASSGCKLPWYLLAGIGKIESNHGQFHGARYDITGTVHPAIFGPPTAYGRAMGPMQFIPPTWAAYATDGNGDGKADPQNIFDATKAAARYLCNAGGSDLSGLTAQRRAVFAYNHLASYVADVLAFAAAYQHGRPESSVPLVPIINPEPAPTTSAAATTTSAPTTRSTSKSASTTPSTTVASTTTPTTTPATSSGPTPTGSGGGCPTTASPSPKPTTTAGPTPTRTSAPPTPTSTPTPTPTSSGPTSPKPTGSTAPTCPACPTPSAPPTSAASTTAASSTTCVPTPTPSRTTRPAATRTS